MDSMEESNEPLRNSTTFLTPGVNEVEKTFPSESFNLSVQLKSLDEVWNFSSSDLVPTSRSLFSTINCRFSILLIFSWRVNYLMTITGFASTTGNASATGGRTTSSAFFSTGGIEATRVSTAFSAAFSIFEIPFDTGFDTVTGSRF